FDRAHFTGFGDSSLDFEVVYWMLTPDFAAYRDVQQAVNLGLMRAFATLGVDFAFPTRTLMFSKQSPVAVSLAQAQGATAAASST
ncbi:MAG: mechanosensitive ion channel family protein, partial [Burkholderiaceae bacterium]|nr:mechanosensitive ion channel family protein [Burkholderiaceae bacterium]